MSSKQTLSGKTDSLLMQQLDQPKSSDELVQAWFRLKSGDSADSASSSPEEITSLANSLVQRVKDQLGVEVQSIHVLPNLNSFMIAAHPAFVRELIRQPEVESARSTNVPGLGLIQPVKSQPVELPSPKKKSHIGKRSK
jgi:hypothetical protein